MSSKGPIRLNFLPSTKIPNGVRIKLMYNFGPVDHQIYGKCTELKGELPFLLPMGSFPVSTYYDLTDEDQQSILNRTIKSLRRMHDEMDEDELFERCLTVINVAALCFSRVPASSPLFEVVVDMISSAYHSDDLFDADDGEFPFKLDSSFVYKKYSLWEGAFAGDYLKLKEIAESIPGWECGYGVFVGALKKIQEFIPDADIGQILRSLFTSGEAIMLNIESAQEDQPGFSEEAKRTIRGYDAGLGVFAELGAVLSEATISTTVRSSLLFRMLTESMRIFGGLINDILGLLKDIRTNDTNSTVVLRRVVQQQMDLQDAVDLETKRLRDIVHDIKVISQKLVETFPDNGAVSRYTQFAMEFVDGQIYANVLGSLHKSRYGSIIMEIVPA